VQEVREKDEAAAKKADEKDKQLQSMKESQQKFMEVIRLMMQRCSR
jgi:hypothetical protein